MKFGSCVHSNLYRKLFSHYGDLRWWPGDTPDEIIAGAVLTQNTSWKNVEKSIACLKQNNMLKLDSLCNSSLEKVIDSVRSSGFYNRKARTLRSLSCSILLNYDSIPEMSRCDPDSVMKFLLEIKGIGLETMESIMLYALSMPVFVVDSYTHRILERIGLDWASLQRNALQEQVKIQLESDIDMMKNYHAMLVHLAKEHCRKTPVCTSCPLKEECDYFMSLSVP